ncbi:hypothetical protein IQ265_15255 [Nodosilinea sp. LEGE 06152]|uniref:hypothetical protein n=1 Tax=Nodosilinea sp. LEGE 06152 TaxID=2777966 RepID=UPI00187E2BC9|nr:hypothetical protein [Nodosilinea sp. LEGE 06152]MBE9158174.1 hypothetical protein [Nodosilinea sp. LEGE 06152]
MIHTLLELGLRQLQGDLGDVVTSLSWGLGPIAENTPPPWVVLSGGAIALAPAPKSLDPSVTTSDFQQELWIEIASPTAQTLEQLTSLTVASLTLRQTALVESFNQASAPGRYTYSAAQVATRHRLRQIQFLGATPTHDRGKLRSQLQFRAIGQLEMVLLTPDRGTVLRTVIATGGLSQTDDTWTTTIDAGVARDSSANRD